MKGDLSRSFWSQIQIPMKMRECRLEYLTHLLHPSFFSKRSEIACEVEQIVNNQQRNRFLVQAFRHPRTRPTHAGISHFGAEGGWVFLPKGGGGLVWEGVLVEGFGENN